MKIAFYAGSFDPMTNGHLDILSGALSLVDRVIVAIGVHPDKKSLFTFEERVSFINAAAAANFVSRANNVEVQAFSGLVVDAAKAAGASILIRGVRDCTDFDYEMQMAGMNCAMAPVLQTVFLPALPVTRPITATLVRQIATMGGDVSAFVPSGVAAALKIKFKSQ